VAGQPLEDTAVATSVEGALAALDVAGGAAADKNPERRRKAAFKAFEAAALPRLKAQFPTLRQSQLQEMIFKEFQRSPDNPMNQAKAK
jgi:hypothetical protein